MRQTIAKKSRTKTKVISPAEQERRRAKTAIVKADIRREWTMLENYYRTGQQPRPTTPILKRLTTAAGRDFRKRDQRDSRKLRVYWQIKGGNAIISRYSISTFGGIRLVPPMKYIRVREAFGFQ